MSKDLASLLANEPDEQGVANQAALAKMLEEKQFQARLAGYNAMDSIDLSIDRSMNETLDEVYQADLVKLKGRTAKEELKLMSLQAQIARIKSGQITINEALAQHGKMAKAIEDAAEEK